MALVPCPDCNAQVSDRAAACIKCGAPMGKSAGAADSVVTTQQTSKPFKALQFLGIVLICCGVVSCVAQAREASMALLFIGFVAYVAGRLGGWWRHG